MLFVYGYHNKINKIKATLQVWHISFSQRPRHKERAALSAFCGSMTVEAAVVLPVFLLVICSLARFFVLIYFQNVLQADIENTARYLGCLEYAIKDKNKISKSYAYLKVISGNSGDIAGDAGVIGGKFGISMLQSDISSDNEINKLIADYTWGQSMHFRMVQKCSYVPWLGKSLADKGSGRKEEKVYIAKNGKVYHKTKQCTYLTRCIKKVKYSNITNMRNIGGGKYKRCESCADKKVLNVLFVYITDYGDRYHYKKECSTLKRYIQEVELSEVGNMRECKKCS